MADIPSDCSIGILCRFSGTPREIRLASSYFSHLLLQLRDIPFGTSDDFRYRVAAGILVSDFLGVVVDPPCPISGRTRVTVSSSLILSWSAIGRGSIALLLLLHYLGGGRNHV